MHCSCWAWRGVWAAWWGSVEVEHVDLAYRESSKSEVRGTLQLYFFLVGQGQQQGGAVWVSMSAPAAGLVQCMHVCWPELPCLLPDMVRVCHVTAGSCHCHVCQPPPGS
jgi:hypothetical protein